MSFRTSSLTCLLAVLILCMSCPLFTPYVGAIPPQQLPTAEFLLTNPDGSYGFLSEVRPSPGSTISPGVLNLNLRVYVEALMETSGSNEETVRETTVRTARLEINRQLIPLESAGEIPPYTLNPSVWDTEFYYRVELAEGLYVLTFSVETPDGEVYAYTWAYRVE